MKKIRIRRLDSSIKKTFSALFDVSILKVKIAKFGKIRIFKHNSALNYVTVKKFHLRGLDLNSKKKKKKKKTHLAILEFLNLAGKIAKFRKIRIFECNSGLNYRRKTKFHISRLDMNTKKSFSAILEFAILSGYKRKKALKFKKFEFSMKLGFKIFHGEENSREET